MINYRKPGRKMWDRHAAANGKNGSDWKSARGGAAQLPLASTLSNYRRIPKNHNKTNTLTGTPSSHRMKPFPIVPMISLLLDSCASPRPRCFWLETRARE